MPCFIVARMEDRMQMSTNKLKLNFQRTTILFVTVVLLLSLSVGAYTIEEAVPIGEYLTELVPGDPDDMLYYEVTKAPIWVCDGFGERVTSESFTFDITFSSEDNAGVEERDVQLRSSLTGGYIDVSDIMAQADIELSFDVWMQMNTYYSMYVDGQYRFVVQGYDEDGIAVDANVVDSGYISQSDFTYEENSDGPDTNQFWWSKSWEGTYILPVNTSYIDVLFYYTFDISGAYDETEAPGYGEFYVNTTPVDFSHALRHVKTEEEKNDELNDALDGLAEKVKALLDKMNGLERPDPDDLMPEPGTIVDIETVDQVGDILRLFFSVGAFGRMMTSVSILTLTLLAISFVLFGRKT